MKKISIFILIVYLSLYSNAQNDDCFRLSVHSEVIDYDFDQINAYGIGGQIFVHQNFSLNYSYSVGFRDTKDEVIHTPGLIAFMSESYISTELAMLAILIPEGVSYHNYLKDFFEAEFYLNLLSTDYNILDNEKFTMTGSTGIKAHLVINSVSVSPYAGLKFVYGQKNVLSVVGVSMNFKIYN